MPPESVITLRQPRTDCGLNAFSDDQEAEGGARGLDAVHANSGRGAKKKSGGSSAVTPLTANPADRSGGSPNEPACGQQ